MRRVWLAATVLSILGCDPAIEDIGKPCSRHSDCDSGLECDVHDGQGTCQKPHDDTGDEEPLPSTGEDPDDDPDDDPDHGTSTGEHEDSTSGSSGGTTGGTGSGGGTGSTTEPGEATETGEATTTTGDGTGTTAGT